jgi:hypothetical protein
MLLVDVPEIMPDDLEGDGIDILRHVAVQLELGRDPELCRRHVRVIDAVEGNAAGLADPGHPLRPSSRPAPSCRIGFVS